MDILSKKLARKGPQLSSSLAADLQKTGLTAAAARQRVARRSHEVAELKGITFPKRARLFYLKSHYQTEIYWRGVLRALNQASPVYAAAIAAFDARDGIIPIKHFEIACGSPIRQSKQVSASTVLEKLISIDLVQIENIPGIGDCALLQRGDQISNSQYADLRARLTTESFLLDAIRTWAGKMNFVSFNKCQIRDDSPQPQFATCKFDLCGPSYLLPLKSVNHLSIKPGFFVGDVLVGKTLDERLVQPFLRKCTLLESFSRVRPFLPVLIADRFSEGALRLCRGRGIVATRPETLFGADVAQALSALFETLSHAAAVVSTSPEKLGQIFEKLHAIEGATGNLRGALFELIVGHIVKSLEAGSVDIGVLMSNVRTGERAQIDVRSVKERNVKIYECKGHRSDIEIGVSEVKHWVENRIPAILEMHRSQERFSSSNFEFEFWTSAKFGQDAKDYLSDAKGRTKKYAIGWNDGQSVRSKARMLSHDGIGKFLTEHYFNDGLSKALK